MSKWADYNSAAHEAAERIRKEFDGNVPRQHWALIDTLEGNDPKSAMQRILRTSGLTRTAPLAKAVTPFLLNVTADGGLMSTNPSVRNAAFYTLVGLRQAKVWNSLPEGETTRTLVANRTRQLFGQINRGERYRHAADAALAIVNDTTSPQGPFQALANRMDADQNAIGRSAIFKLAQQRDANAQKALRKANARRAKRIAAGPQPLGRL